MDGRIIRGIGGFYYISTASGDVIECKAKGIFRKLNMKPLVGDRVSVEVLDPVKKLGNLTRIYPRKNVLVRPASANVDQAVVVFALSHPKPNLNLLDRFLLMMRIQGVDTIICFNKADDQDQEITDQIVSSYRSSGAGVLITSAVTGEGIDRLRQLLIEKTTVMAGPSGVGKSSVMNILFPEADMKTGEISEKIKRGKHTTRHTELFCIGKDSYIMDTPGFTSLMLPDIEKEALKEYYPEFEEYRDGCRFLECMHIHEPDCAVREALERGELAESRYENYKQFFEELKQMKRY